MELIKEVKLFLLLSITVIITTTTSVNADDFSSASGFNGVSVSFLADTVTQTGNLYSFNSINLTNTGSTAQEVSMEVVIPQGWQMIISAPKTFRIAVNEVIQIPVRIAASNRLIKSLNQIKVFIETAASNRSESTFYALVKENSNWEASLITPDLRLSRESSETLFQISLVNSGNVVEDFIVNLHTNLTISAGKHLKFYLAPGKDTVITIGIITELRRLNEFKPQEINIQIKAGKKSTLLEQKVYSFGTIFKENESQWHDMPLSFEFLGQSTQGSGTSFLLNGTGTLNLGEAQQIDFNYRSQNFYSQVSGKTKYSNLDYTNKKWMISIGDQTEYDHLFLDGVGFKVKYGEQEGYGFEVTGVDSRYGEVKQFSVRQKFNISENEAIRNRSLINLNHAGGTNSYMSIIEYDKYFGNNSHLTLEAGSGIQENHLSQSYNVTRGSTAGIKFNVNYPGLTFNTHTSFSTKGFPGLNQGLLTSSSELRLIEKNKFAGIILGLNQREKQREDTQFSMAQYESRNFEVGLKTGINLKRGYFILTASAVQQRYDTLSNRKVFSKKLNVYTSIPFRKTGSFTFSANILNNVKGIPGQQKQFFSFNGFGALQHKAFGVIFSYDFGPNFYADYKSYLSNGTFINRKQISPFWEKSFFKSTVSTRLQADYHTDKLNRTSSLITRAELNIKLNKRGLSIRLFGAKELRSKSLKQDYLSMSIRKNLRLPMIGLEKFKSLKIVLFKDNNHNDLYDIGDEPLEKAGIQIGKQYFTTNKKGEAIYRNISKGTYAIQLGQIAAVRGWVAKNGYRQEVEVQSDMTTYIPFKQSKHLSGRINIVTDVHSNRSVSPANIRITAINSIGETFSTLTDQDGEFSFNLPSDTYLVKINSTVFNDSYRILQGILNVDLLNKREEAIAFEIRERKRKINMNSQILEPTGSSLNAPAAVAKLK